VVVHDIWRFGICHRWLAVLQWITLNGRLHRFDGLRFDRIGRRINRLWWFGRLMRFPGLGELFFWLDRVARLRLVASVRLIASLRLLARLRIVTSLRLIIGLGLLRLNGL
jgi:hypothetical protein